MTELVPPAVPDVLLDESSALAYLHSRSILRSNQARVTMLAGGVSNVVILVETIQQRVVIKQALSRLRVADDWFADPARAQAEAAALQVLGAITPQDLPRLLDSDSDRHALTIQAAPAQWLPWKQHILDGNCDPAVARWLGTVLQTWHQQTEHTALPATLEGVEAFRQLRLVPYFGVSAHRRPDLAAALTSYCDALLARRRCLISGDFSPKNVLVGASGRWVIDLEVAHRGDPAFDVAFLIHHLLLKAVHLPGQQLDLQACILAFLDAYGDQLGAEDPMHLHGLIGCLLLARVIGFSPVDYLTPTQARHVEQVASQLLTDPPHRFVDVWQGVVRD